VPLNRRHYCACLVAALACGRIGRAGDSGARVSYVGGTLARFKKGASGKLHITDPECLVFESGKVGHAVPYEAINLIEYGQQAARRYVLALSISPMLLLSKSRKHYLTVSYKDSDGRQQAMVFRVHKDDVRALMAGLEARTGLKVEFQDQEARINAGR